MFREALKDAKLKDRELAISNLVEGAFWGLPSSFKGTPLPLYRFALMDEQTRTTFAAWILPSVSRSMSPGQPVRLLV